MKIISKKMLSIFMCLAVMLSLICLTSPVSAAAAGMPVTPSLIHDNWDGDGNYTITMNIWWGNNATSWTLYENGTAILTENLTDNSPNAQTASKAFTEKAKGTYTYKCDLKNSFGTVSSSTVTVNVTVGTPTTDPGVGGTWPTRVFAPYVDVMLYPTFSINDCYIKTGQKYYTLAFITANGSGDAAWGGVTPLGDNFYMDEIKAIRSKGGDVIISFGGANGTELATASANTSVSTLQAKYQAVIDKYKVTWIDFDIEGSAVSDKASVDRRNKAIKGLQDKNPNLTIAYCLPVLPSGLTQDGLYILQNANSNGVRIDVVNVMAMDYGDGMAPNPNGKMGDYAIQSGQSTYNQCTNNGISTKIGITPMIGLNDVSTEIFYQSDAQKLLSWSQQTSWMRSLAMWSSTRDNGKGGSSPYASPTSSGIAQQDFEFTNIFKAFTGSSGGDIVQVATPSFSPPGGAISTLPLNVTISCSTAGAVIRYTTNGTLPTASSPQYTGSPIPISKTTTIKATATKPGMTDSAVATANYILDNGEGYLEWAPNTAYKSGDTVSYNGSNYKCMMSHTSQVGWEPTNASTLWQKI